MAAATKHNYDVYVNNLEAGTGDRYMSSHVSAVSNSLLSNHKKQVVAFASKPQAEDFHLVVRAHASAALLGRGHSAFEPIGADIGSLASTINCLVPNGNQPALALLPTFGAEYQRCWEHSMLAAHRKNHCQASVSS